MDRTVIHGREEKQMSTTVTENPVWVRKTKNNRGTLKQSPVGSVLSTALEREAEWHD